jgi:hypothetical protein
LLSNAHQSRIWHSSLVLLLEVGLSSENWTETIDIPLARGLF